VVSCLWQVVRSNSVRQVTHLPCLWGYPTHYFVSIKVWDFNIILFQHIAINWDPSGVALQIHMFWKGGNTGGFAMIKDRQAGGWRRIVYVNKCDKMEDQTKGGQGCATVHKYNEHEGSKKKTHRSQVRRKSSSDGLSSPSGFAVRNTVVDEGKICRLAVSCLTQDAPRPLPPSTDTSYLKAFPLCHRCDPTVPSLWLPYAIAPVRELIVLGNTMDSWWIVKITAWLRRDSSSGTRHASSEMRCYCPISASPLVVITYGLQSPAFNKLAT
jgi:hypothetical protein